jgi:hypothetical protein
LPLDEVGLDVIALVGAIRIMRLASLFGTWMAQHLNPFRQCLALLTSIMENLIEEEIAAGRFRADLDVRSTALTIMAFCQGIGLLLHTQPGDIDGILAQFAQWFRSFSDLVLLIEFDRDYFVIDRYLECFKFFS